MLRNSVILAVLAATLSEREKGDVKLPDGSLLDHKLGVPEVKPRVPRRKFAPDYVSPKPADRPRGKSAIRAAKRARRIAREQG